MKDFIIIYLGSLLMGSGVMMYRIKYRKIPGIKLPVFFRICFFTFFMQNARKEVPIYKILVQIYYQAGNLYLVLSGQALELPKQRMLVLSYNCLVVLTWIVDWAVLKLFYENRWLKRLWRNRQKRHNKAGGTRDVRNN